MRLFNRRKEMEFDDPRLVGMAPLKATEENFGHHNHQTLNHQQTQEPQQQQQSQNLAMVQEEESLPQQGRILTTITGRKSSPGNNNETQQLVIQHQPQDKYSVANGKSLHNIISACALVYSLYSNYSLMMMANLITEIATAASLSGHSVI